MLPHLRNNKLYKAGPTFLVAQSGMGNTWLNKGKATPQKVDLHMHILAEYCQSKSVGRKALEDPI